MASENEIPLDIVADSSGASKELEAFAKQLNTLFAGLNKTIEDNLAAPIKKVEENSKSSSASIGSFFTGLKAAAAGALAVIAGREVIGFFEKAIEEASGADQAVASLNFALAATGSYSEEASKALQEYAGSIQATTTFTDDAVLASLTLGKTFGLSTEKAQELTSAATNLAAVQGISLTAATDKLLGSLNGQGKALKDLGPQFAKLTEEQLTNGDAVRLVNERFKDAATTLTGTFSGALSQANNNVSDFYKEFGKTITQNQTVIKAVNLVSNAFAFLAEEISKNKEGISDFVSSAVKTLANFAKYAVDTIVFLTEGFFNLGAVLGNAALKIKAGFAILTGDAEGAREAVDKLNNGGSDFSKTAIGMRDGLAKLSTVVTSTADNINKIGATNKEVGKTFKTISDSVGTFAGVLGKNREEALKYAKEILASSLDGIEKAANARDEDLKKVAKYEKEKSLTAQEAEDARYEILRRFSKVNNDLKQKDLQTSLDNLKKFQDEAKKRVEQAGSNGIEFAITSIRLDDGALNEINTQIALSLSAVKSVLGGKEGAKELVATAAGAIGDAVIPGIGPLVKDITKVLALGPEAVKGLVREFIDSIPEIITAIAEAAPAFVEAFVDSMVNKGGAIKIGIAIARAMSGEFLISSGIKSIGKQIGSDIVATLRGAALAIGASMVAPFALIFAGFPANVRQAIADGATEFANKAIGIGPGIAQSIISSASSFSTTVVNALFEGANNIYENIILAAKRFVNYFSIGEIKLNASDLVDKLKEAFSQIPGQIADAVKEAIGNAGGGVRITKQGEGYIPDSVPIIGKYATGGIVPQGFPNDTFPAALTSGELVVPTDLVGSLSRFLSNQSSGGGSDISTALLGQIASLLKQPMTVESSVNISGQAFADILLKLSRNNARVAA